MTRLNKQCSQQLRLEALLKRSIMLMSFGSSQIRKSHPMRKLIRVQACLIIWNSKRGKSLQVTAHKLLFLDWWHLKLKSLQQFLNRGERTLSLLSHKSRSLTCRIALIWVALDAVRRSSRNLRKDHQESPLMWKIAMLYWRAGFRNSCSVQGTWSLCDWREAGTQRQLA